MSRDGGTAIFANCGRRARERLGFRYALLSGELAHVLRNLHGVEVRAVHRAVARNGSITQ